MAENSNDDATQEELLREYHSKTRYGTPKPDATPDELRRDIERFDRRRRFSAVLTGAVLLGVFVMMLLTGQLSNDPSSDATELTPGAALDDLYVDPNQLPEVYTGELVDIDADGTPDVSLFGTPGAPVIRPLVEPSSRDWTVIAGFITAGGLVLAAIVEPWAKGRWTTPSSPEPE